MVDLTTEDATIGGMLVTGQTAITNTGANSCQNRPHSTLQWFGMRMRLYSIDNYRVKSHAN